LVHDRLGGKKVVVQLHKKNKMSLRATEGSVAIALQYNEIASVASLPRNDNTNMKLSHYWKKNLVENFLIL
jgi:hypothetical protein